MAVQVQVKGPKNGLDFQLLGNDAVIQRIQLDKEVVFIFDVDNKPLYFVPLSQVRLIAPVNASGQEIPRSLGDNTVLKVHIQGDNEGDFEQICNRIEYTKKFDTMMAELMDVKKVEGKDEVKVDLLLAMPFENIRYVDFNYFVGQKETPTNKPQPMKPQGNNEQKQSLKPKKNTGNKPLKPIINNKPQQ